MTKDDRLTVLELERKEQHRTNEYICAEIKDIKDNHLTHLALAVEDVRDIATTAKTRAGVLLYGLALIAIMIAILTVTVALVR